MFSPNNPNPNSHDNHSGDFDFTPSGSDLSKASVNPGVFDQKDSPFVIGNVDPQSEVSVTAMGERVLKSAVNDTAAFDSLGAARLATAQGETGSSGRVYPRDSFFADISEIEGSLFKHPNSQQDLQKLCPNAGSVAGYKHPADLAGTGGGAFMRRQCDEEVEPHDPDWQQAQGCKSLDDQIRDAMGISAPFGPGSQDPSPGW